MNPGQLAFTQCQEEERRRNEVLMRVIHKAMRAAANEDTPVDELRSLDDEILENLGKVDENRAQTERRYKGLADQLHQRKQSRDAAIKECRLVRRHYLKVHNGGVQAKSALIQRSTKRAGERLVGSGDDYALTIRDLKGKIKKVKGDILILRRRRETQFLNYDNEN
jgi:hypothetical protein